MVAQSIQGETTPFSSLRCQLTLSFSLQFATKVADEAKANKRKLSNHAAFEVGGGDNDEDGEDSDLGEQPEHDSTNGAVDNHNEVNIVNFHGIVDSILPF